ncbi:MAG: riboflavin synthase [Nocardioidaceae bacterium]|jgi:riboflavin synthase|nr:riboflavin synthase [Nocardioidaceae bacterium]
MFTGIVEELGEVVALERLADSVRLTVHGPAVSDDVALGDSIAVNGCCLTVAEQVPEGFTADVMAESLDKTSLGELCPGSRVNLERAVRAHSRLGGHIVQGHVDGTGVIVRREPSEHWDVVTISVPEPLARYVASKGSIAVDGVSLTVSALTGGDQPTFSVSLIPTTLARTTLGHKQPGQLVNLEVDVLAKYVERLLAPAGTPVPSPSPSRNPSPGPHPAARHNLEEYS